MGFYLTYNENKFRYNKQRIFFLNPLFNKKVHIENLFELTSLNTINNLFY